MVPHAAPGATMRAHDGGVGGAMQAPLWHVPPARHGVPLGKLVKGLQVRVAVLQPPPVWHTGGVGQVVGQVVAAG